MKADLKNAYTAAQSYLTDNSSVSWVVVSGSTDNYSLPGGVFHSSKGNVMSGSMSVTSGSFLISNPSVAGATGAIAPGGTIINAAGTVF